MSKWNKTIKSIQDCIKEFYTTGSTYENALINSSTFYLLNIIGGLILSTFPFFPSLLTSTPFYLIRVIILAAVYPSYSFDYFVFTISIPWKSPTPLISPTKLYFLSYYNLALRYLPVYLAFSWSFWYSMTSNTALTAVTAKGFPPYVLKYYIPLVL